MSKPSKQGPSSQDDNASQSRQNSKAGDAEKEGSAPRRQNNEIDETLDDSFPASDPPSWSPTIARPPRQDTDDEQDPSR